MARTKDITFFEMKLLEFADSKDPLLEMLDWMTKQLMELEISEKCNSEKGKHNLDRKTYRSGYRSRSIEKIISFLFVKSIEKNACNKITIKLNIDVSYCNTRRLKRIRMNYATPRGKESSLFLVLYPRKVSRVLL